MKLKNICKFASAACFLAITSYANAGVVFSIKAFSSASTESGGGWQSIDLITATNINCNGTTTDKIRITLSASYTYISPNNSSFLSLAEVMNAAKVGYTLETVDAITFNSTTGFCQVSKVYIYVQ